MRNASYLALSLNASKCTSCGTSRIMHWFSEAYVLHFYEFASGFSLWAVMVWAHSSYVFLAFHYKAHLLGYFNRLERFTDFFAFLFPLSLRVAKVCTRLSTDFIIDFSLLGYFHNLGLSTFYISIFFLFSFFPPFAFTQKEMEKAWLEVDPYQKRMRRNQSNENQIWKTLGL